MLDEAKKRPIKHLMVNTNGVRLATDPGFAERLAEYMPDFELYLQFDSLRRDPLIQLRGADLRSVREKGSGEAEPAERLHNACGHGRARRKR